MVDSLVENGPDTAKIFYQTTAKTSEYQKNPEIKALPATEMTFVILSPSRLPIPSRRLTGILYHISGVLSIPGIAVGVCTLPPPAVRRNAGIFFELP